jgi:hypothetical protein
MSGTTPPDQPSPTNVQGSSDRPDRPEQQRRGRKTRAFVRGAARHIGRLGRDLLAVTLGQWQDEPEAGPDAAPGSDQPEARGEQPAWRVNVLHNVTEHLRGAADGYIAAKLDEIEARGDAKLDHIEHRIDDKMTRLHEQLAELRDRELRHRLRLLKITLIFTVLVALLSLGYKWLSRYWL